MRPVEDVVEWYDSLSSSYDELYGSEQRDKYSKLFGKVNLRNELVLVDLGCGTSELIIYKDVSSQTKYYVGIDISLKLLELASKKIASLNVPADLIAGDVFALPFRNDAFDAAVSISVIRCGDPVKTALTSMRDIVRKNGLLVVSVLCGEGVSSMSIEWCEGTVIKLSEREVACIEGGSGIEFATIKD